MTLKELIIIIIIICLCGLMIAYEKCYADELAVELELNQPAPFRGILIEQQDFSELVKYFEKYRVCEKALADCVGVDVPFYRTPTFIIGSIVCVGLGSFIAGYSLK